MSDGLSKIELKAGGYGRSFAVTDESEDRGLLGTAPDPGSRMNDEEAAAAVPGSKAYNDGDLLPVMIENGLDKIGVL